MPLEKAPRRMTLRQLLTHAEKCARDLIEHLQSSYVLQVADFRYNTQAKDSELTGGIYRAIAPTKQVYKPTEWNAFRVELRDERLKATLNGELIQDVDLTKFDRPVKRHDGTDAPPVKDRPRRGHIGFQHLSRNNEPVWIRGDSVRLAQVVCNLIVNAVKFSAPEALIAIALSRDADEATLVVSDRAGNRLIRRLHWG